MSGMEWNGSFSAWLALSVHGTYDFKYPGLEGKAGQRSHMHIPPRFTETR